MDAETLDKQFQEMEGDTQVQAAASSTQQQKPKQKRVTTAQLQKELNDIKTDLDEGALSWLGELDSRLNHLEAKMNDVPNTFAADITARIEALEKGSLADACDAWGKIDSRLEAMENATGALADAMRQISEGAALWGVRMEECEDSINDMRTNRVIPDAAPMKPVIEFAKPPESIEATQPVMSELAAVADICLTMNDILMITRALKAAGELDDAGRMHVLRIACGRAGETMTPGLQIRAGIKYVEA